MPENMEIIKSLCEKYNVTLSDASKKEFLSVVQHQVYTKNEIVLEQGQISRFMYFIEKGIIRQFYYKNGRDITEHFSCEGDIATCIESLFGKEPTTLCIEAIETTSLYLLDYRKWSDLANTYSDINNLLRKILEYKLIISQKKADSWRFESANERYERFCQEYPDVARRVPVAHIASYLLMNPETLSRVRAGSL